MSGEIILERADYLAGESDQDAVLAALERRYPKAAIHVDDAAAGAVVYTGWDEPPRYFAVTWRHNLTILDDAELRDVECVLVPINVNGRPVTDTVVLETEHAQ